ncbi:hypothetical protein ABL78_3410 [Leptomonas seymouri]|uniref:Uncharacterized protein n=1 Tax=Leptomonas seymouri TaxID=5684 RepID=A0A0N0P6D5_LEPSE|nr:hypothetical protein ABL78_3410 [Leptomonas seymouri]|eukprot:KPI87499.1 hypothetical protein ABL78_3410 [Leptomonas seymouri]
MLPNLTPLNGSSSGSSSRSSRQRCADNSCSELFMQPLSSCSSEGPLEVGSSTSYFCEGGPLPSLLGSACSSRVSVVASLSEVLITESTKPTARHWGGSREAGSSYADNCRWASASIDVQTADTRHAIMPVRGKRKTVAEVQKGNCVEGTAEVQVQGSVSNPLSILKSTEVPISPSEENLARPAPKQFLHNNRQTGLTSLTKDASARRQQWRDSVRDSHQRQLAESHKQNLPLASRVHRRPKQIFAHEDTPTKNSEDETHYLGSSSADSHDAEKFSGLSLSAHTNSSLTEDCVRVASPSVHQKMKARVAAFFIKHHLFSCRTVRDVAPRHHRSFAAPNEDGEED